jgi:hypothetical protein
LLALPPGCEPRGHSETDTDCSLHAYCSVQSQITHCQELPSGRWQCRCEQYPPRTFELEGVVGLQACAVATGVCDVDESELGDETCAARTDSSSEVDCQLTLACSRAIDVDFAPDARAWLVRQGVSECRPTESGQSLACECLYGDVLSEYHLFVDSGESACRPLVDFCMSAEEPELGGDERCVFESASSGTEGCERYEGCSKLMPLGPDVELAKLEPRYANCVLRAGGDADCYCSTRTSSSQIFQVSAAPDEATCAFVTTVCAEDVDIVPTGDVTCGATSQTAFGTTSCEADLSCSQPATVDGQALVAAGRLLLRCAREAPGEPWGCSCASDQKTAQFTLGAADASAWEACSQAPAGCLEHLDVHLGAYGELVYPP